MERNHSDPKTDLVWFGLFLMKNFTKDNESVPSSASQFSANGRPLCSCTLAKRQQSRVTQFQSIIQCNPFCPYATKLIHHTLINVQKKPPIT